MLLKFLVAFFGFVVLASAKECKPSDKCELKCCATLEGDVHCRNSCLGLSCELDMHILTETVVLT